MVPLQLHGIHAIDLDRPPGSEDWLVIAIEGERLVPVRTDPALGKGRLAVVVHTDPPPSEDALTALAGLVSDATGQPTSSQYRATVCARWACEAATRVLAAVEATDKGRGVA
jgi:hypothetical protein